MNTSGVTTTQMDRDAIVAADMRACGDLAKGQTPSPEDLADFGEMLNNLVAELQTKGMPLWSKITATVALTASQQTYTIGVGQAINQAFPLKVLQAWLDNASGGSKQILYPNAIYDFNMLPSGSSGTPSQYTYQPLINYGRLSLWPTPDATTVANKTLYISYMAPFEDFQSASDTPYFPREWNNTLIFGLAWLIAPSCGVPLNDQGNLLKRYETHLANALDFGLEEAPVTFAPDRR
jgi:hypothetical protein